MAGKISKNCVICENEFFVYPSTQSTKTCSRKCSAKLSNQTRTTRVSKHCVICGKPFEVTKGRAKATRACSKKCASILGGRTQNKQATLICEVCGKPFKVPPCRERTAKTCSNECAVSVRAKSKERKAVYVCKTCGKKFTLPQSHALRRVYCSVKCQFSNTEAQQKRKEIRLGKNNPMWKGGITPESALIRCSAEYALWRESVFARDNWTCQECGKVGTNLNAHHIKPFAKYSELRFAIKNGQTLCEPCHRKEHFNKNTNLLFKEYPRMTINLLGMIG